MQVFVKEQVVVVADANLLVALDCPSRSLLARVAACNVDAASGMTLDLYSRAFASAAVSIRRVVDDGNGKTKLVLASPLPVKVGDLLNVAGTSVAGYNSATAHRVAAFDRGTDAEIVTGVSFTAEATGGTVQWTVPSIERPLYKIGSTLTALAGAIAAQDLSSDGLPFTNLDPIGNINTGFVSKIYAKFAATGTYRVVISGRVTGPM